MKEPFFMSYAASVNLAGIASYVVQSVKRDDLSEIFARNRVRNASIPLISGVKEPHVIYFEIPFGQCLNNSPITNVSRTTYIMICLAAKFSPCCRDIGY